MRRHKHEETLHEQAERISVPSCDWLTMPMGALSDAVFAHADRLCGPAFHIGHGEPGPDGWTAPATSG